MSCESLESACLLIVPALRGWTALDFGEGLIYKSGPEIDLNGRKVSLLVYGTTYDEEGKPLPATVTITADAELRPGTDLSRIRWLMAEATNWPDELGDVLAVGDFSTGLVQTIRVPGEWTAKSTGHYVWVRPGEQDLLWWQFKLTRDAKSLPR